MLDHRDGAVSRNSWVGGSRVSARVSGARFCLPASVRSNVPAIGSCLLPSLLRLGLRCWRLPSHTLTQHFGRSSSSLHCYRSLGSWLSRQLQPSSVGSAGTPADTNVCNGRRTSPRGSI